MGVIYGLYSTLDGAIRYVEQTEYTAQKRLDLIVTKALDHESGVLYDWVRGEWRAGGEIRAYVLQDDIIPADLEMYEYYWIKQFAALLNTGIPANRRPTEVGRNVTLAIQNLLRGETA